MIHYLTPIGIGAPWVAVEMRTLERAGIVCDLTALRKPQSTWFASKWGRQIHDRTHAVYPLDTRFALSMVCAPFVFHHRYATGLWNALFGRRESLRKRVSALWHFFVACDWACRNRGAPIDIIHAQWIHSAGTIGMYGAWLLGVPFSFTGHAVDLFRERVALEDKIQRAVFIVCISSFHRELFLEHGAHETQLITVRCGIDVKQFEFRECRELSQPPHIISLGRLIEKKGFEYLIDACAILRDRGVSVRCTIGGDGPLAHSLQSRVREKDLGDVVNVTGEPVLQEELADFMHSGDIYAQPCVWSSDNDVDGTPRTLMEAMACGLPSISTRLAGIPDIIEDGVSGLLVKPNDPEELADAIERVVADSQLARRLSKEGRAKIEKDFKLPDCLLPLEDKFREMLRDSADKPVSESVVPPEPVAASSQ